MARGRIVQEEKLYFSGFPCGHRILYNKQPFKISEENVPPFSSLVKLVMHRRFAERKYDSVGFGLKGRQMYSFLN